MCSEDQPDKYLIENGDLLVSWSGTLGAFAWDRGRAALNQHIFRVDQLAPLYDATFHRSNSQAFA